MIRKDRDKPISALAKSGTSGFRHYSGMLHEEWHPNLEGSLAARVYRQIYDNDGYVGGAIRCMRYLIGQAEWPVRPPEDLDKDSTALYWANFVDECLGDMDSTWSEMLSSILSMCVFGYAIMYKQFKVRRGPQQSPLLRSKYDDGLFGLRDIEIRAQETLDQWDIDENTNELLGAWQVAPPRHRREYLERERFALFRIDPNKGSPEGRSLLRNVYRPWYLKTRREEIRCIGEERNLAGYPVIRLPRHMLHANASAEDKATVADYVSIVQRIKRDQLEGLVFPAKTDESGNETGFDIQLLSAGGRDRGSITEAIKDHRHEYLVALQYEMALLGSEKVGSFALSSDKTHLFSVAIGYIMDCIVDVFNHDVIPHLMRLNRVPKKYWPLMSHGDIEKPSVEDLAAAFTAMVGAGIIIPTEQDENYWREQLTAPTRDPDDTVLPMRDQSFGVDAAGMPTPASVPVAAPIEQDLDEVDDEVAISVDDAAARLNVPRSTLMRGIRTGKLPGAKFGNSYRIMPEDLRQFMRPGGGAQPQPAKASTWQTPTIQ